MSSILSEQEKVRKRKVWLRQNGWTFERLSQLLNMSRGCAFGAIGKSHARPELVERLRTTGLPEDLLPEARYVRPGPKPKRAEP